MHNHIHTFYTLIMISCLYFCVQLAKNVRREKQKSKEDDVVVIGLFYIVYYQPLFYSLHLNKNVRVGKYNDWL